VLLGDVSGYFVKPAQSYRVGGGPAAVTVGDLDNDGRPEVVVGSLGQEAIVLRNVSHP